MSGKVVGWAFEQNTGSQAAKLVLVKLADNAGEEGFCWPSVPTIVEHTELSQSAVYKHLATLEGLRLIKPKEAPHPDHGYTVRGYQLQVPWRNDVIPPRRNRAAKIPRGGKEIPSQGKGAPPGGKEIPPGGIPYKEEPSIEPSKNPRARERLPDGPLAAALKEAMGPGLFRTYFAGAQLIEREDKPNRLLLATEFYRSKVTTLLGAQVRKIMGDNVEIGTIAAAPETDVTQPYWLDR
ncbi:MAG TPA: helix-turn-helix domain-containing protein [Rhizomicrobium sp.]